MSLPRATDRRRLLAVLPTTALGVGASCLGLDRMDDLTIYNNTGRSLTVEIGVTSVTDETSERTDSDEPEQSVFSAEWSLDADTDRRARDGLPARGQFTVTVSVPSLGTASHQWRRSGGTEGLVIWLDAEGVEFGTLTN